MVAIAYSMVKVGCRAVENPFPYLCVPTIMETTTATVKHPVLIYTEQTPNPESLKFVTNTMLYSGTADFRTRELADQYAPIASALFDQPYVKRSEEHTSELQS